MRQLLISERIKIVRRELEKACIDAGREPDEVLLVAVAKTQPIGAVQEAANYILDIGENYAQELRDKSLAINTPEVRWHFIGSLQANKAKYVAQSAYMLHSLHSANVAKELEKHCKNLDRKLKVLLQVNISNEATKSGVSPQAAYKLAQEVMQFEHLELGGFMAIPAPEETEAKTKRYFQMMQELKSEAQGKLGVELPHLSMGMSHDFRLAIQHGATIIRIGTAIFGERNYSGLA